MSRTILLPPYLITNPLWVEFVESIDELFQDNIDQKSLILGSLRNMWLQTEATDAASSEHEFYRMIDFSEWGQMEKPILVKQANMLGMYLTDTAVVDQDAYQRITRYIGQYWFGKGKAAAVDFMNYCLKTDIKVLNTWTTDYVAFYTEGDPAIGTPVWQGGPWYPTTHVTLEASANSLVTASPATLIEFFYEISNYNLVVQGLNVVIPDIYVIPEGQMNSDAEIVALTMFMDNQISIPTA